MPELSSSSLEDPAPLSAGHAETGAAAGGELTAVILTRNEAANVADCVRSLAWADRVLVFDAISDDDTVALARAAGAEVLQAPFENFAQQRNKALDAIQTDWVFFVDADERGTARLGEEIRQTIGRKDAVGWYVPRHNYIFGRLTLGAGWYPDYQFRLLRHGKARYERPVHEIAVADGEVGYLEQPLVHYNYRDVAQFREKQRRYAQYDAGILQENGVQPRLYTFVTMPLRQFWWRFASLKGYRDGLHGLKLSLYMAYYEWVKYRLLARMLSGGAPNEPVRWR